MKKKPVKTEIDRVAFESSLQSKLQKELERLRKLGFNSMSEMLKAKRGK